MQTILVYIIFAAALAYAGWRAYKTISHKHTPGCPKCEGGTISHSTSNRKKG